MHYWKIISRPWLGIRLYQCTDCGCMVQKIGNEILSLAQS